MVYICILYEYFPFSYMAYLLIYLVVSLVDLSSVRVRGLVMGLTVLSHMIVRSWSISWLIWPKSSISHGHLLTDNMTVLIYVISQINFMTNLAHAALILLGPGHWCCTIQVIVASGEKLGGLMMKIGNSVIPFLFWHFQVALVTQVWASRSHVRVAATLLINLWLILLGKIETYRETHCNLPPAYHS